MIKRNIILAAIVVFFSFEKNNAQSTKSSSAVNTFTGKPRYQILTKRAGVFLGITNVELFPLIAPLAVKNFDSLVSKQFYDSTAFHRVIPNFMIQGGDPNSRHGPKSTWGYGDPSQPTVPAEFSILSHQRGILSAARDANINSANSQFFICVAADTWLDGQYSIYGHVTSGMDIVDTIVNSPRDANDDPLQKIEMFVTYIGSNDTIPNAPVLLTPASGTQNVPSAKIVTWSAVSGAIMYHLDVSVDSLFSTFFLSKDVLFNSCSVTLLQGSTTYYWRVRANNGGNISTYSPVWNFSTTFNSGVNNLSFAEQGYRLEQNVPNPGKDQTLIKYSIPDKEKVILKLFDVQGRELSTIVNEEKNKGDYQVVLDLNKFAAGIYFYKIQAGKFSDAQKMILKK